MAAEQQHYETWLEEWLESHGATTGTIHVVEEGALRLKAWRHIPPQVLAAIQMVPKGRGMAGLAWEREEPVQTCNLKQDSSGDVRAGAKAVDAKAAVALPVHDPRRGVVAVAGIGFDHERELDEAEIAELEQSLSSLPLK